MTETCSSRCRGMIVALLCLIFPHTSYQGHPTLLFATQTDIRIANIIKPPKVNLLIKDLKDVAAVDYYYEGGLVCWTDRGLEMIQCAEYNGTSVTNKYEVINNELIFPDGLACDWVTKKLYWTDGEKNRIEVATLRGKHRKVLIWTDIDQPRAIALVPSEKLMFWTDWGEVPKIERVGMDGDPKTRKTIVTEDIFWPNGLTVDLANRTIYWIDGHLNFIESMDFEGRNRHRILDTYITYSFGLDFYQNRLFWSDWEKLKIYSYELGANQPRELLHGEYIPSGLRVWDPSRQPPSKSPCQERNGGCSHLCLLSESKPNGYSCACPTGVKLLNETTCANGPHEMLIIVQRTDICWVSLDSADYSHFIIPVTGIKHAIGVDYDPVERYVYWTDDEAKVLRRAHLDGGDQVNLISTEVQNPGGIAVDWVARNMYWTDTGTDRIEVARLNGDYRRVIVNKDLNEPRAIAVAPDLGWLFWSDWYELKPKIERTALDGSDRTALVSNNLGWPNGIALDIEKMKIYWCDAKLDKIEVANMDGSNRREVANRELPHLFGLSLLGDYLYWTDWQRRNIERIDKNTGGKREVIIEQMPNLMDLKAIRLGPIKGTNPCGNNNGGCSHLCLNRPNNNYVCFCQIAYELASDNKTCYLPDAFLLYAQKENISKVSLENSNIDLVIPVKGVREANNLDFDFFTDHIYWTDTILKTISKSFRNGSDVERLVEVGLESPKGLAVDWVSRNLFWTDSIVKRIEVSRLNGRSRRVILWNNMGDPRSISVHPFEGNIYWCNWDATGSIERAAMDGTQREVVVEKVGRPNGLTNDLRERRLYWTELTSPAIEYYDLKYKMRHKIITNGLYEPTGLTHYKERIYWSDAKTGLIESANKTNGKNRKIIHSSLPGVSDIKVFFNVSEFGQTPCSRNHPQCSHLCLSVPDPLNPSKAIGRCSCPSHWRLLSDNRTCQEPKSFILSSTRNTIIRILPDSKDNCPYILLPIQGLKNLRGIEFDPVKQHIYWIDGRAHAIKRAFSNGSHAGILVPQGPNQIIDLALDPLGRTLYWTDDESRTINVTRLNGNTTLGIVIKGENDDEKPYHLAIHPEQGLLFWTDVGTKRIMRSQVDGNQPYTIAQLDHTPTALTIDRRDHHVCWAAGKSIECANLEGHERWTVMDDGPPVLSLTVHGDWIHFWNKENEKFERIHKTTHYMGSVINILPQYRKNLTDILSVQFPDIWQLEEHPCSARHNYGGCSHLCMAGLRHSVSSSVASIAAICSCPIGLVLARNNNTCRAKSICGPEDFACAHPTKKDCIPSAWRCDGQADCDDGSDEMNCQNQKCANDFFQCPNGNCIPPALVCDGSPHCSDQSDELHCCKQTGQFMCRSTFLCIPPTSVCDGIFNCEDNSDEAPQMCAKLTGDNNRRVEMVPYVSNKSTYVVISIFGLVAVISSIIFYTCRRKLVKQNTNLAGYLDDCAGDPLSPKPNQAPRPMITKKSRKTNGFNGTGCPSSGFHGSDSVHMSMINGSSSTSNSYDRGHLTGASSSITEGACALQSAGYPLETLNPPPSPATTADSNSRRTRNGHPVVPDDYCCNSSGTGTSRYRPYRHYRTINQPPPPTPCSTDVCDESDSNFTNNRRRYYHHHHHHHHHPGSEYDSDPFPPPPTPRSYYLSDVPSCPPSPSSTAGRSSTYFNPLPPPPSPVPSPGDS